MRRLETALSVFLALAVVLTGCGICLIGTLAARGDLSWSVGGTSFRLWLIREQEGAGLALSETVPFQSPEGLRCQRTRVWFWLWFPRWSLQHIHYEDCPSGVGPAFRPAGRPCYAKEKWGHVTGREAHA